MRQKYFGVFFD